jgi:hypothetical protein
MKGYDKNTVLEDAFDFTSGLKAFSSSNRMRRQFGVSMLRTYENDFNQKYA